jgi:hypothetical protein
MSMQMQIESQHLLVIRIHGSLRRAELDECQRAAVQMIRAAGQVAALIVLDNFEGWERGDEWGDVSFLEHDTNIAKMAIVGEERWRDEVLMFAGAGLRHSPVRYFTDADSARAWLGDAPPSGMVSGPTGASR